MIEALRKVIQRMHCPLSLRHIKEVMAERSVYFNHASFAGAGTLPAKSFSSTYSLAYAAPGRQVPGLCSSDVRFVTNTWEGSS